MCFIFFKKGKRNRNRIFNFNLDLPTNILGNPFSQKKSFFVVFLPIKKSSLKDKKLSEIPFIYFNLISIALELNVGKIFLPKFLYDQQFLNYYF